jgi:hypothetical protein
MASFFRNTVVNSVGMTPVTVLSTAANARHTVIGLSLANLTNGIILVDIRLTNDAAVTGYYIHQMMIPPNSSLRVVNGGEKLILAPSNTLTINANMDNALDVIASYVEII